MKFECSIFCLFLTVTLTGCITVGPDHEEPELVLPDSWTHAIEIDNRASSPGTIGWWRQYHDPTLNNLIHIAQTANPNIHRARFRIIEGWHQRGVLAAAFYPHVDSTARDEYGLADFSEDGLDWDPGTSHGQLAQIDSGWEIDLFGRIKRQVQGAEAEWESRVEGWRDSMVFITAEVAIHYFAIRTLEKRLEIAKEASATFAKIHRLTKTRREEGLSSLLEVKEAEARFKTSEAQIPRLASELEQMRNGLARLLGLHPGRARSLVGPGNIPTPPHSVAVGYPAELLRSRPDIRRAERKIARETADIGVAKANLYPRLSISGAITYEYLRRGVTREIFRRNLGLGATLRQRIFHACADHHRIYEQEAQLEGAIKDYEIAVIAAVTEVEDSLARVHYEKERLGKLEEASEAHQRTAELMIDAYKTGLVDLRRLLNAQFDYYATWDEEAATRGRRAAHTARLFKALGGGELPINRALAIDQKKEKEKMTHKKDEVIHKVQRMTATYPEG